MKNEQGAGGPSNADQSRGTPVDNRDVVADTLAGHRQDCEQWRAIKWKDDDGNLVEMTVLQDLFDTNRRSKHFRRRLNVRAINVLALDVDPFAGVAIETSLEDFLRACDDLALPHPTMCIATGGKGWHAHWHLDEPMPVAEAVILWRRLAAFLWRKLGITEPDALTRKLHECGPERVWPMPGQKHRKTGVVASGLRGYLDARAYIPALLTATEALFQAASADLRELINPTPRQPRPSSDAHKAGPQPEFIRNGLIALGHLPGKQTDDNSWPDWAILKLAAIAGDIEHGGGGTILFDAVVERCAHSKAAVKLFWEEPTDVTAGTFRYLLKRHWPKPAAKPGPKPGDGDTGPTYYDPSGGYFDQGLGRGRAKRRAPHPEPGATAGKKTNHMQPGELSGENFESHMHLIAAHYHCRFNRLTRQYVMSDGSVMPPAGFCLDAQSKGLRVWDGNAPFKSKEVDEDGEPVVCKNYRPMTKVPFRDAIKEYAHALAFYPQQEELEAVMADDNIDPISHRDIATRFLKAPNTGLHKAADLIMEVALMGMVQRIVTPGSKLDLMPVLYAPQGRRKSSFCRALGGNAFLDGVSLDDTNKDQLAKYSRYVVGEVSEFSTSRRDQNRLKSLQTTTVDSFRVPYGEFPEDFKRTILFVATTNDRSILNDPTGSRRYGVIDCTVEPHIDVDLFQQQRDGILKSAALALEAGDQPFLTWEQESQLMDDNRAFQIEDDRVELLWRFLRMDLNRLEQGFTVIEFMTSDDGLGMRDDQTDRGQPAIRAMLRMVGLDSHKGRRPGRPPASIWKQTSKFKGLPMA